MMNKLSVSPSPHARDSMTTSKIMTHVAISLMPALLAAVFFFGGRALTLTGVCVLSSVIWEKLFCKITKRADSTGDMSAVVTGMLLAFNLPVTLPYWIACIGTFISIVIVKMLFGGLGQNFANPAIVGRIVLMLSFTAQMNNWSPANFSGADAITGATPLASGQAEYMDLFLGSVSGCMGEVSAAALLIGACYLGAMQIIKFYEPLAFCGTVFVFSVLTDRDGLYQVLAGGLILGAFFMGTDYVTTPITNLGKVIFGIGCGIITCVIRFYGSYAEGVSFSILIMNILTPYINRLTEKKPIGAVYPKKKKEAASDEK